jgi:two-component system, cell cycle sensor histidine kinase and response regulator CckA
VVLAKGSSDSIDLLLTDVIMPEMNGKELSTQLLSMHPDVKVLYVSGYTANVIAHHGIIDEGINFLQKPFSKKDLSLKIREVLDE